ncbi:MAG: DsrE family protein [Gammaproteobacteria bacterium]|nr:DsrE family protein [Gammaproteobacteria bacterium]
MNQEKKFSDEFINAFVDDQLTLEEKQQVYAQLSSDETLKWRICELRKTRDLVALAYKEPPMPTRGLAPSLGKRKYSLGVAAGLALMVGTVSGWFLHQTPAPTTLSSARLAAGDETAKVLIHVSDGHVDHLKNALDEVESLMQYYRDSKQTARVEVVTNGQGLSLLLANVTPFAERVQSMQKKYPGLSFVACQNTIERFQQETGVAVKLLPGVIVIDSGVAQIMRRQHQGWAYIQV